MRRLLVVLLMLGLAGSAMASTITGNTMGIKPAGGTYTPPDGPRQAGDTIGSATAIASLPFSDSGVTNGYFNDYDEICPYSGSASPDVVYSYVAGSNVTCLNVDLCNSSYDTKVYIYENAQGNLIACNDDFYFAAPCYVYASAVLNVTVVPGNTYYIVVDGYGSASGTYQIDVTACTPPPPPPPLDCPPNGVHENEPACGTNYVDNWNGGCNSTPQVWQALDADAAGCGTMCGLTCTYLNQGSSYRDTDWFDSVGLGGNVSQTCITDFPFMMALMYGPNCNNLLYIYILGNAGVPGNQSYPISAGAHVWTFMAPSVFSGVPNGQYVVEVCGIAGGPPNPTETTTWGSLKNQYK